jgi:phenylpropionate dioxygenase-like ring-hydroxylating dioxygenase large terminal subunit
VEPRHYFGRELVLYRSASGEVSVVDAYCPHLGAHLGPGGPIWSNKRYQPAPTLNEEESAIGHFRRWFRRFYSAETAG